MENDRIPCFTVCPWHGLAVGDVVLYVKRDVHVDVGRWSDKDEAGELLCELKVEDVPSVELNAGLSVVSMRPETTTDARSDWVDKAAAEVVVVVRTLYKDGKYCMNYLFSRTQAIVTDLLACRPSELIESPMGSGFFPWSRGPGDLVTRSGTSALFVIDSMCLKVYRRPDMRKIPVRFTIFRRHQGEDLNPRAVQAVVQVSGRQLLWFVSEDHGHIALLSSSPHP
ncbi:hypothetical protein GOODEAATRI_023042 [Goodea atripinnis]|uniref:Uncharacterized protein n=1 Tax=Goodea atripinnis TaxID=208336 RepID=A0ABV0NCV3_9TELE